ncbi:hypothetical protein ACFL26_00150 [Patescibacteria group bacterium]
MEDDKSNLGGSIIIAAIIIAITLLIQTCSLESKLDDIEYEVDSIGRSIDNQDINCDCDDD